MELYFNITGFLHFPSSFIWGHLKSLFCKEVQRSPRDSLQTPKRLKERTLKALPSLLPCFDKEEGS